MFIWRRRFSVSSVLAFLPSTFSIGQERGPIRFKMKKEIKDKKYREWSDFESFLLDKGKQQKAKTT